MLFFLKTINFKDTASTLFRGSCEATKLMPVIYARVGSEYLRKMIGPLVKDIVSSNQSFEVFNFLFLFSFIKNSFELEKNKRLTQVKLIKASM